MMPQITLVGRALAEVGKEFYFEGPNWKCQECKLRNVCFNLEDGARYKVTEVRTQEHDCPDFDGDKVVAVMVEKIPTPASVPKKQAIEGSVITYQVSKCQNISCDNYWRCHAHGKEDGVRYTIVKMYNKMDCPLGEELVAVDLF